MMIFSYFLIAATLAAYAVAAIRFTTHGTGRHSAETLKCWPLSVRGMSTDVPVLETPALAEVVAA